MGKLDMVSDFTKAALLGALSGGCAYALTHDEPPRENPAHVEYLHKMYKWDEAGAGMAMAGLAAFRLRKRQTNAKDPAPK